MSEPNIRLYFIFSKKLNDDHRVMRKELAEMKKLQKSLAIAMQKLKIEMTYNRRVYRMLEKERGDLGEV